MGKNRTDRWYSLRCGPKRKLLYKGKALEVQKEQPFHGTEKPSCSDLLTGKREKTLPLKNSLQILPTDFAWPGTGWVVIPRSRVVETEGSSPSLQKHPQSPPRARRRKRSSSEAKGQVKSHIPAPDFLRTGWLPALRAFPTVNLGTQAWLREVALFYFVFLLLSDASTLLLTTS